MRVKLIFSLMVIAGLGLLARPVYAQEDGLGNSEIQELNSHQELNLNDDKTLIMDTDAKSTKANSIARDTPAAPQANVKKQESQQKSLSPSTDKAQEDPLSFNFLYFIIQKFKISDIMDD